MKIFQYTILTFLLSCSHANNVNEPPNTNIDYREEMRSFVNEISSYTETFNAQFLIIPQNGQELLTTDGNSNGQVSSSYINSINGVGREDLFYGYTDDNTPTPDQERNYMIGFLDLAENNNIEVLVTDYCWDTIYIDSSYQLNNNRNYISFAADSRDLNEIPVYPTAPYNSNNSDITSLSEVKNFLYLINPEHFPDKDSFIALLQNTNYDLLIIDLFFNETISLTSSEINSLKIKNNGGKRIVLSYISIGEAENYRYYWQNSWNTNPPDWLCGENPNWQGNFRVKYWADDWKNLIFGNDSSYIKKIIDAGFDGVYLDIIDAFEYFEESQQ